MPAMSAGETKRGSSSIEMSRAGEREKRNWLRSVSISSCNWPPSRKLGVPPPRCTWITSRSRSNSSAIRPISRYSRARYVRSEEHTSELQSLMRISYAVFCLKKKTSKEAINKHAITKARHVGHRQKQRLFKVELASAVHTVKNTTHESQRETE